MLIAYQARMIRTLLVLLLVISVCFGIWSIRGHRDTELSENSGSGKGEVNRSVAIGLTKSRGDSTKSATESQKRAAGDAGKHHSFAETQIDEALWDFKSKVIDRRYAVIDLERDRGIVDGPNGLRFDGMTAPEAPDERAKALQDHRNAKRKVQSAELMLEALEDLKLKQSEAKSSDP